MRLFPLVLLSVALHGTQSQGLTGPGGGPVEILDSALVTEFLNRYPLPDDFVTPFCPPSDHEYAVSLMVWAFGEENCEITQEGYLDCGIDMLFPMFLPAVARYIPPMVYLGVNNQGFPLQTNFQSMCVYWYTIIFSLIRGFRLGLCEDQDSCEGEVSVPFEPELPPGEQELPPPVQVLPPDSVVVPGSNVKDELIAAFGEENCQLTQQGGMDCELPMLPNGFTATAEYKARREVLSIMYSGPYSGSLKGKNMAAFAPLLQVITTQRLENSDDPGVPPETVPVVPPGSNVCPVEDHERILDMLLDAFGENNCSFTDNGLVCDLELRSGFTASAEYVAPLVSLNVETNRAFGLVSSTFSSFDTCSESFSCILFCFGGVKIMRTLFNCFDSQEDIVYKNKKGIERTTTCKKLAEGKRRKFKLACRMFPEVAEACPGLCKKKLTECECVDMLSYNYRINKKGNKRITCSELGEMDEAEKEKKCKQKRFNKICPSACANYISGVCFRPPSDEMQILGLQEDLMI